MSVSWRHAAGALCGSALMLAQAAQGSLEVHARPVIVAAPDQVNTCKTIAYKVQQILSRPVQCVRHMDKADYAIVRAGAKPYWREGTVMPAGLWNIEARPEQDPVTITALRDALWMQ